MARRLSAGFLAAALVLFAGAPANADFRRLREPNYSTTSDTDEQGNRPAMF
jgi:hypothetical protein